MPLDPYQKLAISIHYYNPSDFIGVGLMKMDIQLYINLL